MNVLLNEEKRYNERLAAHFTHFFAMSLINSIIRGMYI